MATIASSHIQFVYDKITFDKNKIKAQDFLPVVETRILEPALAGNWPRKRRRRDKRVRSKVYQPDGTFIRVQRLKKEYQRDPQYGSLPKIEVESFSLKDFWTEFETAVQGLSNEVTKIGFMCGQAPYPRSCDLEDVIANLLQYYNMMRDLYCVLPKEIGQTLHKLITSAAVGIMGSLQDFVLSLNNLTEQGAIKRLSVTGAVWEACKAVQTLPRDNVEASLKVIDSEKSLASDALEELNTEMDVDTPETELNLDDIQESKPEATTRTATEIPMAIKKKKNRGKRKNKINLRMFRPDGTFYRVKVFKDKDKPKVQALKKTIEEDQDGEVSREEMWSDEERDLAQRAVGLVKVTLTCLQRVKKMVKERGSCESPELCLRLDLTNKAAQGVSPALDDFVSELYHPVHFPTALENAGKLADVLRYLVSNISQYDAVAGKDVFKKLLIFINHNHAKVDPSSGNPVSNFSNLSLNT